MNSKSFGLELRGKPFAMSLAAGRIVWILATVVLQPGWAASMLLLAALVLVPLGLRVVASPENSETADQLIRWATRFQFPAAVALVCSISLPVCLWAGLLSLPWLLFTLIVSAGGLFRWITRRVTSVAETCADAGLVYIAVGGVWTVVARFGLRPMGIEDILVLLTAVHFHYAGFVLPLLAGQVARAANGVFARAACIGVIAGVPAVAVGIAFSPQLEWLAALALAVASGIVAILQVRFACRIRASAARACLLLSGSSLIAGMVLASGYAMARFWGLAWLTIPQMLPTHGAINALGFALLGLIGWNLVQGCCEVEADCREYPDGTHSTSTAGDARHEPAVRPADVGAAELVDTETR